MNPFALLLGGHLIADCVFQSDTMAKHKARAFVRAVGMPPWWWWLAAHAAMHGAMVYMILGRVDLACGEFAAHGLIDFGKCEHKFGLAFDQSLHVACKVLWVILARTTSP